MPPPNFPSVTEQVAAHLRQEIGHGAWGGMMPGSQRLAAELEVNRKTVETALRQLEREGLLVGQGAGHKRLIVPPAGGTSPRPLRVAILLSESQDRRLEYMVELQHLLLEAGHTAFFAPKSLHDLGMNVKRVAQHVEKTAADAWVVLAGSREVLEWFASRPQPAFAFFGRMRKLVIAGAGLDMPAACAEATRALIGLGHRRIVLVSYRMHRMPEPGATLRACLSEMEAHGIQTGPYNMPAWEESTEGFRKLLESLFRLTPPTALIVDGASLFTATLQFLGGRGIRVPEDVSLVCTDPDPTFVWCQPPITHINWASRPLVRRTLRWVSDLSRGKSDLRQSFTPTKLVAGGTIGLVKNP